MNLSRFVRRPGMTYELPQLRLYLLKLVREAFREPCHVESAVGGSHLENVVAVYELAQLY